MPWGRYFENVHMTPYWNNVQQGRRNIPGPGLRCRQTNLLQTWLECDKSNSQTQSKLRDPYLCERCQFLSSHSDELFQVSEDASHIWDGSPEEDQQLSNLIECALCAMLQGLPTYKEGQRYGVYVVNLLHPEIQRLALGYEREHFVMGLAVSEDNETRRLRGRLGHLPPPMEGLRWDELIIPTQPSDKGLLNDPASSPYYAQTLDPVKADFESAKAWILECKESHPSCRATGINLVGNIHVIDCTSRQVIPLAKGVEYVALSYVWGPPRPSVAGASNEPVSFGTLPADMPRTITDALSATLLLGFRYLWCDRYCIDQSDPVSKAAQIAMMESIYETAVTTLVAAAGQDDTHGLPGVPAANEENSSSSSSQQQQQPIARDPQLRTRVGSSELVSAGPGVGETVRRSKWATRAWTFQEAMLSTRCLVFGPKQLQFLCKTMCKHETLPRLPRLSRYDHEDELSIGSVFGGGHVGPEDGKTSLTAFVGLANELLRRDITHESDTLDAFRGILNRMNYASFWGIPLITREGRELAQSPERSLSMGGEGYEFLIQAGHEIATLKDTRRIVAASKLDPSKKRKMPNLFHSGTYMHYMYDEFPGPGEPFRPSPTLAFLYGLTWARHHGDVEEKDTAGTRRTGPAEKARRERMPSWSWVSMSEGVLSYQTDPATGSVELAGDVLLNIYSHVQVWIQNTQSSLASQTAWIPFDEAWADQTGKVIQERGSLIKLSTLTGEVERLTVSREPDWQGRKSLRLSLRAPPVEDEGSLELVLDHESEMPPHLLEPGTHTGLGWRIVLVCSMAYYNLEHPQCWESYEPGRVFLVLERLNGVFKRIGTTSKAHLYPKHNEEDMMHLLKRDTVVIC